MTKNQAGKADPADDLGRLLEVESHLEQMLTKTRLEAEEVVRGAQESAQRERQKADETLQAELDRIRASMHAERTARLTALAEEARRGCERYDRMDEAQFQRLVAYVRARLIGADASSVP
jgi:IMP dehydrogenase/GMP reductase